MDPLNANQTSAVFTLGWRRRWLFWLPFVRQHMQDKGDFSSATFSVYRDIHQNRLLLLKAIGFTLTRVRRSHLDNPLISEDAMRVLIHKALNKERKKSCRLPKN